VKSRCPTSESERKCSHLCLLVPGGYMCACPDGAGFKPGSKHECDAGKRCTLLSRQWTNRQPICQPTRNYVCSNKRWRLQTSYQCLSRRHVQNFNVWQSLVWSWLCSMFRWLQVKYYNDLAHYIWGTQPSVATLLSLLHAVQRLCEILDIALIMYCIVVPTSWLMWRSS